MALIGLIFLIIPAIGILCYDGIVRCLKIIAMQDYLIFEIAKACKIEINKPITATITSNIITQITKNTVTTSYVNALSITAGSVAAVCGYACGLCVCWHGRREFCMVRLLRLCCNADCLAEKQAKTDSFDYVCYSFAVDGGFVREP